MSGGANVDCCGQLGGGEIGFQPIHRAYLIVNILGICCFGRECALARVSLFDSEYWYERERECAVVR